MGFGLMVSVFLAASAAMTWILGSPRVRANPAVAREMRPIALVLLVAYVGYGGAGLEVFLYWACGVLCCYYWFDGEGLL